MAILAVIGEVLLLVGLAGLAYTLVLALVAASGKSLPGGPGDLPRVAVLIPAHNEEARMGDLLGDLRAQTRAPAVTLVVADRCTDGTVAVAGRGGAEVLTLEEGGGSKGAAVRAGLAALREREWDAVLVLDADCRIGKTMLARCRMSPHEALQSQVVLEAASRARGRVYDFLSRMENELFHGARARLGLPGFLRGTGMFLGRGALERCPWGAEELTEDRAQGFLFLRAGVPVRHDPALRVDTLPPQRFEESWSQRRRWISVGLPSHLLEAGITAVRGWRFFGPRLLELPLAVLADARSQWMLLLVVGTLVLRVTGGAYRLGAASLILAGLLAVLVGIRWYGRGFLGVLVQIPVSAGISLLLAALSLIGIKPGSWNRGRL